MHTRHDHDEELLDQTEKTSSVDDWGPKVAVVCVRCVTEA